MPPKTPSHASRFMQDVFRWNYEVEKLRVANSIKGMRQVRPESLRPYPSDWISPTVVRNRIAHTSLRRAVTGPERLDYLKIWLRGRKLAEQWAKRVARSYFSFQTYWPQVMSSLWDSRELAQRLEAMGTTAQSGEKDEGTGK